MMPLETAPQTLDDLNPLYPEATDVYTQGDDHIRSIKNVLATQFPGIAGQGFEIPITTTEEEINFLSGLTSNLVDQYVAIELAFADVQDSVPAPYGTVCLFNQAAAPTGWEQITTYDDYMVRIVNTAGGAAGGTDSPFSFNWDHTHTTSSFTLSLFYLAPHTHLIHTCADTNSVVGNTLDKRISVGNGAGPINSAYAIGVTGSNDPHTHGYTLGTTSDFTPLYLNTILARCTNGAPQTPYYDAVVALAPTSYWLFNETSGLTAVDVMGAQNGTYDGGPLLNQAPSMIDGRPSVFFDGDQSDNQMYATNNSLYNQGSVSYALVIQGEEYYELGDTIMVTRDGQTGGSRDKRLNISPSTGHVGFSVFTGTTISVTSATPILLGVPNHIVVTNSAAEGVNVYLNGVRTSTSSSASFTGYTNATILVGGEVGFPWTTSNISDVAVWARALTPAEVATLYAATGF